VIHKSTSLKYEPSSEPLHISEAEGPEAQRLGAKGGVREREGWRYGQTMQVLAASCQDWEHGRGGVRTVSGRARLGREQKSFM